MAKTTKGDNGQLQNKLLKSTKMVEILLYSERTVKQSAKRLKMSGWRYQSFFSKTITDAIVMIDDEIDQELESHVKNNLIESDDEKECDQEMIILDNNEDFSNSGEIMVPGKGDKIEVYWPLEDQYYADTVGQIEDGKHTINHTDGDVEQLDIPEEIWKYLENTEVTAHNSNLKIVSNEQEVLSLMQEISAKNLFYDISVKGLKCTLYKIRTV